MENFEETQPIQPADPQDETLIVTEEIRSYIYETAKWTHFLSIVGFILCGFMVIFAFSIGAIMNNISSLAGMGAFSTIGSVGSTISCLLCAFIYFYPSLLLFKYSSAAKKAVLFADQISFAVAMGKMKSLFKFWGIFTIIILAFYIIIFLFAIVAGIGASSMAA